MPFCLLDRPQRCKDFEKNEWDRGFIDAFCDKTLVCLNGSGIAVQLHAIVLSAELYLWLKALVL